MFISPRVLREVRERRPDLTVDQVQADLERVPTWYPDKGTWVGFGELGLTYVRRFSEVRMVREMREHPDPLAQLQAQASAARTRFRARFEQRIEAVLAAAAPVGNGVLLPPRVASGVLADKSRIPLIRDGYEEAILWLDRLAAGPAWDNDPAVSDDLEELPEADREFYWGDALIAVVRDGENVRLYKIEPDED